MVLSNELHMLYLLSPISLAFKVNWNNFHRFYKNLLPIEIKICNLIGIDEEKIVRYGHEMHCQQTYGGFHNHEVSFKRNVEMINTNVGAPAGNGEQSAQTASVERPESQQQPPA